MTHKYRRTKNVRSGLYLLSSCNLDQNWCLLSEAEFRAQSKAKNAVTTLLLRKRKKIRFTSRFDQRPVHLGSIVTMWSLLNPQASKWILIGVGLNNSLRSGSGNAPQKKPWYQGYRSVAEQTDLYERVAQLEASGLRTKKESGGADPGPWCEYQTACDW